MAPLKIAALLGSMRGTDGNGAAVATYFKKQFDVATASMNENVELELVEPVSKFHLPFVQERTIPAAAAKKYQNDSTQEWSNFVQSAAAIVLVTPVYNGGPPASLKLALDLLFPEWEKKPVGVLVYGGGGTAVLKTYFEARLEQSYKMSPIRPFVGIPLPKDRIFQNDRVDPSEADTIFAEHDENVQGLITAIISRVTSKK